jgi:predicted DNA-binding helix-hairpin-helix protein
VSSVDAILTSRRHHRLRLEDVARLCSSAKKVRPFIVADDWTPGASLDDEKLRTRMTPGPTQLSLF